MTTIDHLTSTLTAIAERPFLTSHRGTLLTVPDGSAETFTDAVDWVACNLEYAPSQWKQVRDKAAAMNIKVIPWRRLAHEGDNFETIKDHLNLLVSTAQAWGSDTILPNYEDEAKTYPPAQVAEHLYGYVDWDGLTGWSLTGWLFNAVDWTPIAHDPALLQIFPADLQWPVDEIAQKQGDCVEHARDKGFTYVGVTYQTYAGAQPAWFDVASYQHSTFPGNVIASGQWGEWYV
jgi:hypothetical protein